MRSIPLNVSRCGLFLVTALVFVLSSPGCQFSVKPGYLADDKMTAIRAIDEFHARYNAEQTDLIYHDAHEAFRQAASETDMAAAMMSTRHTYGDVVSVTDSVVNPVLPRPVNVKAVYNTKFAKGDATEYFLWVIEDGKAKLALYKISPGTVDLSDVKKKVGD